MSLTTCPQCAGTGCDSHPDIGRKCAMCNGTGGIDGDDETAWIVWFEDPDHRMELFSGFGAERAAREYYEAKRTAWSCHLFRKVT